MFFKRSGTNKFNLRVSASDMTASNALGMTQALLLPGDGLLLHGEALHPLVSPAYEDVPIWNILPSYQLYESTFSKAMDPTDEDMRHIPPTYETSSLPATPSLAITPSATWDNSIQANTQNLKRLAELKPKMPQPISMEVFVTEGPVKEGVPLRLLDVSSFEYQQGDNIHGYILVENKSDERISFDLFTVIFEGKFSVMGDVNDAKRPLVYFKFLNMFDYLASWTPATTSGLEKDPQDGTNLVLPMEKYLEPHVVYKKVFNFRVPERLLDCACESHSLQQHCEVHPSIGLARDQFMQRMRKLRRHGEAMDDNIKDLSFPDTSISYSVEARLIGRASQYNIPTNKQDEFIILQDSSKFVRMVPKERLRREIDPQSLDAESAVIYRNLVDRITDKIRLGHELTSASDEPTSMQRQVSISKRRQLYDGGSSDSKSSGDPLSSQYIATTPLKTKKTLTSASKVAGTLQIATPRQLYTVDYIPAFKFRNCSNLTTQVEIPLDLTFHGDARPPEIKSVHAEIVVFTYRSRKYPVPIEILPEMVFKNVFSNDNFETHVSQVFKRYLQEITVLTQTLNHEVLGVDSQLIMDMKALAELQCKYHHLRVEDVQYKCPKTWAPHPSHQGSHSKRLVVSADLISALSREVSSSSEDLPKGCLVLVPNFQSCIIGRLYFVKVEVRFHGHEPVAIKLPLAIVK